MGDLLEENTLKSRRATRAPHTLSACIARTRRPRFLFHPDGGLGGQAGEAQGAETAGKARSLSKTGRPFPLVWAGRGIYRPDA